MAERDSLVTKCPSKFTKDEQWLDVADVGSACLAIALLTALYAVGASSTGRARGGASGSPRGGGRSTASPGCA